MLTEDADASTAAHEFMHEYVNALIMVASQENAPPAILEELDVLLRFWKIEGETAQALLAFLRAF